MSSQNSFIGKSLGSDEAYPIADGVRQADLGCADERTLHASRKQTFPAGNGLTHSQNGDLAQLGGPCTVVERSMVSVQDFEQGRQYIGLIIPMDRPTGHKLHPVGFGFPRACQASGIEKGSSARQ